MAILAYLSGRRAALRGSGMRSNFADSFRATHLQSGLRTRAHPLENRAPIAQTSEPSQRAPNRTGTVAHDLCARPLRIFSFQYRFCSLVVRPLSRSFPVLHQRGGPVQHQRGGPVLHQRGGPVLHQRGSKWRERPPRLRIPLGSGPPWLCASRGSGASFPTGGRSRHSDPCRKARIAEG